MVRRGRPMSRWCGRPMSRRRGRPMCWCRGRPIGRLRPSLSRVSGRILAPMWLGGCPRWIPDVVGVPVVVGVPGGLSPRRIPSLSSGVGDGENCNGQRHESGERRPSFHPHNY